MHLTEEFVPQSVQERAPHPQKVRQRVEVPATDERKAMAAAKLPFIREPVVKAVAELLAMALQQFFGVRLCMCMCLLKPKKLQSDMDNKNGCGPCHLRGHQDSSRKR